MLWSEFDRKLLQTVAALWVDSGGDAEGLDWNYSALKEMIQAEIQKRVAEKESTYD